MESTGLVALADALKRDQEILAYPKREWVRTRLTSTQQPVYDCVIIGGGQSGLGVAKGLLLEKVNNILVVDENPPGREGPWSRFARMPHLRTPKHLTGLDFGNPNLTFFAFYVAKYGQDAYDSLSFIPTEIWVEYLCWYRESQSIPLRSHARVRAIRYDDTERCLALSIVSLEDENDIYAKAIVLANGIDGCGSWQTPAIITDNVPREHYAHTCEPIEFSSLRNLRVGVLGAGASAFDNALMALQADARSVHLFSRRKPLPHINPYRWAEFVGFLKHLGDLDDLMRWRFISRIIEMGQLPPKTNMERALKDPKFVLQIGQPWLSVRQENNEIVVQTAKQEYHFDFIIVGTGFVTDLALRPELSLIAEHIMRWSDRFVPPPELAHDDLARHPYLGSHFELQARVPHAAPYLSHIFCYNFGNLLSLGFGGGSISGLKYSLPRIVSGITRTLFVDEREYHLNDLLRFDTPEYDPLSSP